MPALPSGQLVDAILGAIHQSGGTGLIVSAVSKHPRQFIINLSGQPVLSLWVYAWTLTHGGRPALPNEFRIQMTGVSAPLELNPSGTSVLIGYDPNLKMFAGFDLQRHRTFTTGSPSVQIDINTLHRALQDGLAFSLKSNDEIVVGIRPDQFLNYVMNAADLHRLGIQAATFSLLNLASSPSSQEDITEESLNQLGQERRRIVQTVSRMVRAGNFRRQVLDAYENRCAVTRAQLRLVDAAHILPIGAPGSSDVVQNGIALSPTYHRAFDQGLIYLTEQYEMRINFAQQTQLQQLHLDAGLTAFVASLGTGTIYLPQNLQQRPSRQLIRSANRYRHIPNA